jgi:hypothetical protein
VAGGAVHGPPYQECRWLTGWYIEYQPWIAARAALAGVDLRSADLGLIYDLTFGLYVEMGLTEKGDKRLEWIKKVLAQTRTPPEVRDHTRDQETGLPTSVGKPVNEN